MSIRKARAEDLRAIGEACAAGFDKDELFGDMMHPHRKEHWEDFIHFFEKKFAERMLDAQHVILVAVDGEPGRVVGIGDWRRGGKVGASRIGKEEFEATPEEKKEIQEYMDSLPKENRASDPSKMTALDEMAPLIKHYWTGEREEHWDLRVLAVHSEFEGKGHGKRLSLWGVEEAKKEGIAASVIAADAKDTFYARLGFKKVGMANVGSLSELTGGSIMFIDP